MLNQEMIQKDIQITVNTVPPGAVHAVFNL